MYWVSVLLRMRSFTVRFKTRIHLTSLFWFNHEFSFSVFHHTTVMVLPIYKCAFHYTPSASSNSHAFDSVEILYLQTSLLTYYWYFGRFHSFRFSSRLIYMLLVYDVCVCPSVDGFDENCICTLLPKYNSYWWRILILVSVSDGIRSRFEL